MSRKTTRRPVAQPRRQFVPALPPDLPVEDLRLRTVLGRVRSPALASVIASHCFAIPEVWGGAR
jgi:hypothetical protein